MLIAFFFFFSSEAAGKTTMLIAFFKGWKKKGKAKLQTYERHFSRTALLLEEQFRKQ
jgi:hypothetical protein